MKIIIIDSFKTLDKLVAIEVMKYELKTWEESDPSSGKIQIWWNNQCNSWSKWAGDGRDGTIWTPSQNIENAWEVVSEVYKTHEFTLEYGWIDNPSPHWHCHLSFWDVMAETPKLSICVASLLSVGILVKPDIKFKPFWECWYLDTKLN